MQENRWCIRVLRSEGEKFRKELLLKGILDRSAKIRSDGEYLLIPLISQIEGAWNERFECNLSKEGLPRFEHIGGIAIMREDNPGKAAAILEQRTGLHTVLFPVSAVNGLYRTKKFKVLAGKDTTATVAIEYGHRFFIDLSSAYFSARLSEERQRVLNHMKEGETVIDMFAGVGPFAITLAEKARIVYACDINPEAVSLMIKNISANHTTNIVPILADAVNLPSIINLKADRIIMNLPMSPSPFMDAAFKMVRIGGMIHLYSLVSNEEEYIVLLKKYHTVSINTRYVRSYSPDRFHVVYEVVKG